MTTAGLRLTGVSKRFGGSHALDNVDFTAMAGEVHALLGQNGAGKSTLVKILTGVYVPEPGARLELWGQQVPFPLVAAHKHGIAVIHQDLGLVEQMTVVENMGITAAYGTRLLAPIAVRRERQRCVALLRDMHVDIDPDTPVSLLNPAERAALAIARAKRLLEDHSDSFVFVLDEPTAYLDAEASSRVLALMRTVADSGSAVVFVSHRLQEVAAIADRISVLRDGIVVDTFRSSGDQSGRIILAMLGRAMERFYPTRVDGPRAELVLRVSELVGRRVNGVSFDAGPGEILGFAGLTGMGQEEIPYLLSGAMRAHSGRATLGSSDLLSLPIRDLIELGVCLVPGNRQRDGLWPLGTARENVTLPEIATTLAFRKVRVGRERQVASSLLAEFGVRPCAPEQKAASFSGGNQQKMVLAKWMRMHPRLLLLDEPTQGVDAGAKFEVLQMLSGAAFKGATVVVASGDYEQLAHICHRVLVLRFGKIVTQLTNQGLTEAAIARSAQGA